MVICFLSVELKTPVGVIMLILLKSNFVFFKVAKHQAVLCRAMPLEALSKVIRKVSTSTSPYILKYQTEAGEFALYTTPSSPFAVEAPLVTPLAAAPAAARQIVALLSSPLP